MVVFKGGDCWRCWRPECQNGSVVMLKDVRVVAHVDVVVLVFKGGGVQRCWLRCCPGGVQIC